MYLRVKRFCAGAEDNRMRPTPVSTRSWDRHPSVGLAEAKERMVRENSGYELMSLDLTGEPFPKPMEPMYTRCNKGHVDLWYDSTDSDKCPLCSVRERRE
jgi:hypothetical protein